MRNLLARISHQLSAAADDARHPAVLSHLGVLQPTLPLRGLTPSAWPPCRAVREVPTYCRTLPRPSGRKPSWAQHLVNLETKPGEKCGLVVATAMVVLLGGCAHQPVEPPPAATLEIMHVDGWPALADDFSLASLQAACAPSIDYFERVPSDRIFTFGPVGRSAAELADGTRRACEIIAASAGEEERRRALQDEFLLLRSVGRDGRGEVLFTGYYEPLLDARREASESFEHPIYGVPSDVVTVDLRDFGVESDPSRIVGRVDQQRLVPYHERDAIDFGDGLPTDADVIGYVDDQVDAFFLHVQGSGTLVFPDGGRVRAGYALTNGRSYRSIGRLLIDDGLVSREEMSMQAIRTYLENNPDER